MNSRHAFKSLLCIAILSLFFGAQWIPAEPVLAAPPGAAPQLNKSGKSLTYQVPDRPSNASPVSAPNAPQLIEPADGATDVSVPVTLSVNVSDPENQPLDVTFYGAPLQGGGGSDFTVIAIPDPQFYAALYPSIYYAQMQWVVDHKASDNIVFVASLGDNVDDASEIYQWDNADTAWSILEAGSVPYGLGVGNKDGGPSNTQNFNIYFGESRFAGRPDYGGHFGSNNDNSFSLFNASGLKFVTIFIEYDGGMTSTSHPVLQWANSLLQTYSDRRAIVVSHNMLQGGTSTEFSTQGGTIYEALKENPNLFLMMGGHLGVASRRSDTYNGNTVYTLRSDYQGVENKQSGYLRIMRFSPGDDMIYVRTYSPTQDKDYDGAGVDQNNFSLPYTLDGGGFEVIGTVTGVASGENASIEWDGLASNEPYEWYVVASDGSEQTTSDTWSFTTEQSALVCYSLALGHTGQGSDPEANLANTAGCPAGKYVAGEAITLSGATPGAGWQISSWTGTNNNTSTAGTNVVSMPAQDHSAGVNYTQSEYSLTIQSDHGTATREPDRATYHLGDVVTLTAFPDPGWSFVNWSGDASGTNNPIQVTVNGNMSLAANCSQIPYNLTVVSDHGTVTKEPDQAAYHLGDVVSLTASPEAGWCFEDWSGDASGTNNPIQVTISGDMELTANYSQLPYNLTVVSEHGSVMKNPDQATYHFGDVVTLTAAPDPGWSFANWSGDASGTNNPIQVTIIGDMSLTANYSQSGFTLTVVSDHGTVTKNPDRATYYYGDVVTLAAAPDPGWSFVNWSGDASGTNNPSQVTISGDTSLTANYSQNRYTLEVNVAGSGNVTLDHPGPYTYGEVVRLTATAQAGWAFVNWGGDASGNENPLSLTIDGSKAITANFKSINTYIYLPVVSRRPVPPQGIPAKNRLLIPS